MATVWPAPAMEPRPTPLKIEPAPDESECLPLWPRANRRISGGLTIEANLGQPLPSTHATSLGPGGGCRHNRARAKQGHRGALSWSEHIDMLEFQRRIMFAKRPRPVRLALVVTARVSVIRRLPRSRRTERNGSTIFLTPAVARIRSRPAGSFHESSPRELQWYLVPR